MSPPLTTTPHDGGAAAAITIPCNALLSKPPHPGHVAAAAAASLAAAADRFLITIGTAASNHPLLKPLLAFPSHFQSFVQVRQREARVSRTLVSANFAAILPGDSVAGLVVANGIGNFLNIYNTLLVVRLVLTWFPNSPPAIVSPLSTICDPYLNIFRGIIPPLGGTLDLSPILAFLVLNALTSTASALPAELPVTEGSRQGILLPHPMLNLTKTQEKWMKRFCSKRSKSSDETQ